MEEETPRGPVSRTTIVQMVVVGIVASALGIALGLVIDWFPAQASTQADKVDTFWDVLIIVSVPVFVLVTVVVGFAMKEFRQRPGEELLDGPPIHGNTRLEVVWTAIPAIILVVLCGYAYKVLHDIEKAPAQAAQELKVQVYGQQFTWTFEYREDGKKVKTTRLYLPEGRSVKFEVHSKDVLHDFWIPAMRMKIDAVPGITTSFRVTPNKLGRYPIVCAELCGLGHAFMRQTVYVLPEAEFNDWLAKKLNPAPAAGAAPGAAAGADGKAIFTDGNANGATACGSCHQLADAGTGKGIGPSLDEALAGKDAAFIKEAIVDPGKEVESGFPANVMPPNYGDVLSPEELDAVVKYLTDATSK
jgi:cytochrome c oxidase subunit 2